MGSAPIALLLVLASGSTMSVTAWPASASLVRRAIMASG